MQSDLTVTVKDLIFFHVFITKLCLYMRSNLFACVFMKMNLN